MWSGGDEADITVNLAYGLVVMKKSSPLVCYLIRRWWSDHYRQCRVQPGCNEEELIIARVPFDPVVMLSLSLPPVWHMIRRWWRRHHRRFVYGLAVMKKSLPLMCCLIRRWLSDHYHRCGVQSGRNEEELIIASVSFDLAVMKIEELIII